jgi:hypothetical protein
MWKVIELNDKYEISDTGLVRNVKTQQILKMSGLRYPQVSLTFLNRKQKTLTIHRLVADTFLPNTENKPVVNHINGLKHDNRVENLEWSTVAENNRHARKQGLCRGVQVGAESIQNKLEYAVQAIKPNEPVGHVLFGARDYRPFGFGSSCIHVCLNRPPVFKERRSHKGYHLDKVFL